MPAPVDGVLVLAPSTPAAVDVVALDVVEVPGVAVVVVDPGVLLVVLVVPGVVVVVLDPGVLLVMLVVVCDDDVEVTGVDVVVVLDPAVLLVVLVVVCDDVVLVDDDAVVLDVVVVPAALQLYERLFVVSPANVPLWLVTWTRHEL